MKYFALICARGGSKGLINKNLKKINNIHLIGHAINIAKSIKKITKIIVSTDCKKIAKIAKHYGAEVPFLRPKEISSDKSHEIDAWKHAIDFLISKNFHYDALISLPCTAPLRLSMDVHKCIRMFETKKFDSVITIKNAHRNPYFNMVRKKKNFFEIAIKSKNYIYNRQQAPELLDVCTICYISSISFVSKFDNLFQGKVGAIKIPQNRSIDIDNNDDYQLAKYLYEKKIRI